MTRRVREDGAVVDLDYGAPWDVWGICRVDGMRGRRVWFGDFFTRDDADKKAARLKADPLNTTEFEDFRVEPAPALTYAAAPGAQEGRAVCGDCSGSGGVFDGVDCPGCGGTGCAR